MSKKPRREIRVGNPFGAPESTPQHNEASVFYQTVNHPQKKPVDDPAEHPSDGHLSKCSTVEPARGQQLNEPTISQPRQSAPSVPEELSGTATTARADHPVPAEDDKKKSKFESLRQKYLKKESVTKPAAESAPAEPVKCQPLKSQPVQQIPSTSSTTEGHILLPVFQPPVESPPLPIHATVATPLNPQPVPTVPIKSEIQYPPAAYKTSFQGIIDEVRKQPELKPSEPTTPNPLPFDLKATYRPSLPLKQARKNINAPEPPQVLPAVIEPSRPEPSKSQQPTPVSQLKHIDPHLLTSNPSELVALVHRYGYVPDITFKYLYRTVLDVKYEPPQHSTIQYNSHNRSMEPWVRTLFQKFILENESIPPHNYQTVWEFIGEFFPPLGDHLSTVFVVTMVKLSPSFYKQYEQELVTNCLHYLKLVREHAKFIELPKREEFAGYLLNNLNRYITGDEYCRCFIHLASEFITLVKDEHIGDFNKECKRFEWAACVYLLLSKHSSRFSGKGTLNNLIYVVSYLQEKGFLEDCVTVLDGATNIVIPTAYSVTRELRSRVINKLAVKQAEAKKGNKGGIFGFFNQALQKISNSKPSKDDSSLAVPSAESTKSSRSILPST